MRTRSSSNFTNGHIKALIGRRIKISGTKKTYEYQVEHMDENEPKYFIEENLLRDLIHNSAFDEYERMERSGETNIRIVTKAAGNFTLKHSYKEENVETDLKENFEVKRKRSKETPVTNPSTNNNDYSSDESVEEGGSEEFPKGIFYGTTAYE
uniref:Uncharacterized protein n=1 Tax=Parastrongyloides trichosuri TaxID=131310 RepID=A0A0N4Z600_PARTI